MRKVELGPEDLVEAGFGADLAAGEQARDGPIGLERVGLGVASSSRTTLLVAAPASATLLPTCLTIELDEPRAVSWKRAGLRNIRPRSKPAVAIATLQPLPSSPSRILDGDAGVVEEDLREPRLAVELLDRPHGDAGQYRGGRG